MALALLAIVFAIAFALPAGGCKYTDVLTEHIEDEELGVLDPDADPIYVNTPGAPEDPDRMSSVESDSDRIDDQESALPRYDENSAQDSATAQREHEDDADEDDNASEGDERSEDEGANAEAGEGELQGESAAGEGEGTGPSEADQTQPESGEGPQGPTAPTGGIGGVGETYDTTGPSMELPEDVTCVAAAGDYATIVQMLAGEGGLVAADEAWIARVAERGVFPGEGVESLAVAWTGAKETGYAVDVSALIAAAPDAVLTDNASAALTAEQEEQIKAAGIHVVVVPAIGYSDTPDEDILSGVAIVGELLKSAPTANDASAMASAYVAQHDEAIANCLSANAGYSFKAIYNETYPYIYQGTDTFGTETKFLSTTRVSTAYIDSWTYDVNASTTAIRSYSGHSLYLDGELMDSSGGAGLSATTGSQSFMLIDYYLQVSGVVNNSYEGVRPAASGDGSASGRPYLIIAGDSRELVTGSGSFLSRSAPSALWYSVASSESNGGWVTVGDAAFPTLLVKTPEIAQSVVDSASRTNGLYNVGQSYGVRVVPDGFAGCWAEGTVESFLLAPWARCALVDGGDLSASTSYVEAFYLTFYRCASPTTGAVANYDSLFAAPCPTS